MSETAFETPASGVAALAASADDGPLRVRGVAIGENDVTHGQSKRRILWPRETLEEAAAALEGTKIVDDSAHEVPDGGDASEVPKQPPVETIRGEVTDAHYEPGVGVVFEGEVDDEHAASLVENGRVEVSPFVFHTTAEEDTGLYRATDIAKWRDVALVAQGASETASIEPAEGGTEQVAAMSAAALSAGLAPAFDDDVEAVALASFQHLRYDGTKTGKLDESNIPDPPDHRSHYLFPAESKSDSSFPVVDGENRLRRGNVEAAWDLRGHAPVSQEEIERVLVNLASKFDNPPVTREDAEALAAADSDDTPDDDPDTEARASTGEAPADADDDSATSDPSDPTMDLTEDEQALVRTARNLDDPTVVEADVEALAETAEELNVTDYDDPLVVESEEHETQSEALAEFDAILTDQLVTQKDFRPSKAAALSFTDKLEEFEDEDGNLDAEALVQEPETGATETPPDDPEPDAEALSEAKSLARKVLSLKDVREMEAAGLEAHEYVQDEYDADPLEYDTERALRAAMTDGE